MSKESKPARQHLPGKSLRLAVEGGPRCVMELDGKAIALEMRGSKVERVVLCGSGSGSDGSVLTVAAQMARIDGVVPGGQWLSDVELLVPPLAPREVTRGEVRWEVRPDLWLVHVGVDRVRLRRASTGRWKGSVHLTPAEAWRLMQALAGVVRWQKALRRAFVVAAKAQRVALGQELRGDAVSNEAQPTRLFGPDDGVCIEPEAALRMPLEVSFAGGEVLWARGGDRDDPDAVLVELTIGTELADVAIEDVVRLLVRVDGVVPDESRRGPGIVVEPLEPDVADASETRWEVTTSFALVQAGEGHPQLVARPGTVVGYENAAELDGPETWRLARAFVALALLRDDSFAGGGRR